MNQSKKFTLNIDEMYLRCIMNKGKGGIFSLQDFLKAFT